VRPNCLRVVRFLQFQPKAPLGECSIVHALDDDLALAVRGRTVEPNNQADHGDVGLWLQAPQKVRRVSQNNLLGC